MLWFEKVERIFKDTDEYVSFCKFLKSKRQGWGVDKEFYKKLGLNTNFDSEGIVYNAFLMGAVIKKLDFMEIVLDEFKKWRDCNVMD